MPTNYYSQSLRPFKTTLIKEKGHKAKPGDAVIIITLSGRQGDHPGAAGGHFAIGSGTVQEDMTIKGETFNFYFEGEKEVLAGNTDLNSYFGHLIQGQQNYRPTYTMIAYGKSASDLKKVRDNFEKDLHLVRTMEGLRIQPQYNCSTTSNYYLSQIGVKGIHRNFLNNDFRITYVPSTTKPTNPENYNKWWYNPVSAAYALIVSRAEYMPRETFESYVKGFASKSSRRKMGIKRVDYIFIPQYPSQRQIGGMSLDSHWEGYKSQSLGKKWNKKWAPYFEAQKVIDSEESTEQEKFEARQLLEKAPNFEEDQKEVKEFLDTID